MSELLLLHHAQGLTPGVHALADRFRAAGHVVHVPDLYDGRTFDDLDEGVEHARELGDLVHERGVAAAEALPDDVVVAGMSLGAVAATLLAVTRPVGGVLLLHACVPPEALGAPWPAGVPGQVHVMAEDGWGDVDDARALAERAPDVELFLYPGSDHLFSDSSLAVFDPAATDLLVDRALALLSR
ncbi:MAG: hypothetical protein JWM64_2180 [Frankiales bacterium]|nr:hypothetical protein [Frankiales bacterium]